VVIKQVFFAVTLVWVEVQYKGFHQGKVCNNFLNL